MVGDVDDFLYGLRRSAVTGTVVVATDASATALAPNKVLHSCESSDSS